MSQNLEARPLRYHLVILCLWEERGGETPVWRFSLEDPQTSERRGFKTLDELTVFLKEWTQKPQPEERPMDG